MMLLSMLAFALLNSLTLQHLGMHSVAQASTLALSFTMLLLKMLCDVQATTAYEDARAKVARFINAPSSRDIVFTANATAGINLVAQSWGRKNLGVGDEVSHPSGTYDQTELLCHADFVFVT